MLGHFLKIGFVLPCFLILYCSNNSGADNVSNASATLNPTAPKILQGAIIYAASNAYHIDFLVDRTTTAAEVQQDISVTVPDGLGGTQTLSGSSVIVAQGDSYSGTYYTASFVYSGNQDFSQVQVCSNSACSSVTTVDVIDTKQSVGFKAISRAGFGYGLYVSLLMPNYEMQPVKSSIFFSSKDPGLYPELTPLWTRSEVDWEFVPKDSVLTGYNELLMCPELTVLTNLNLCKLYWTSMKPTETTPSIDMTGQGYTLDRINRLSGLSYLYGQGGPILDFNTLEGYVLSAQGDPIQFKTFDDTPHGVPINFGLMGDIFKEQQFLALNIVHMPYGNVATTVRPDIDVTKIPKSVTFLEQNYTGHGLLGTEVYRELTGGPIRTGIGATYSHPTALIGSDNFMPYKKFYYYAVNYSALSMDFYIIDPDDTKLKNSPVNNTNIGLFTPVRSFKIRDALTDRAGSSVDRQYHGLMKFGLDEPPPPPREGCHVSVRSYGSSNGFCALKWQIQSWLLAGHAGSESASKDLLANNYLKKIAIYDNNSSKIMDVARLQEIDFTLPIIDQTNWRYVFQQNFAISHALGPILGDGVRYLNTGFWNLSFDKNPVDGLNTLIFTQMPYATYVNLSNQQEQAGNYVYALAGNTARTEVVLDLPSYAYAAVDSWMDPQGNPISESEYFSIPAGQTASVKVYQLTNSILGAIVRGALIQTCSAIFNQDKTVTIANTSTSLDCTVRPKFALSLAPHIQINSNPPEIVKAAQMTGCSEGRCTFTVSWTNPSSQHPLASFLIVPHQQWASKIEDYYQDLVSKGGALVPATQTSATLTVDQQYVGPAHPNVTIYACTGGSCPSANNSWVIANIPSRSSTDGFDLQAVTKVSTPIVAGQTITTTWANPAGQDPEADCYLNVVGMNLSDAVSYLQKCSTGIGTITFKTGLHVPLTPNLTVKACVNDICMNSASVGPTVKPVSNPSPATLESCSEGRCTFRVSWTNPSSQPWATKYVIVPLPVPASPNSYYQDLIINGGALVSHDSTKTLQTATFTVHQSKFVGPSNPNVMIYVCEESSCPSQYNNYKLENGVGSVGGKDLLPMVPVATTNNFANGTLSVTWTSPAPAIMDSNAMCYIVPTGAVLSAAVGSFLYPCTANGGSITLSQSGLPSDADPKTFYIGSCIRTPSGASIQIDSCPAAPTYNIVTLPVINSAKATYGQ